MKKQRCGGRFVGFGSRRGWGAVSIVLLCVASVGALTPLGCQSEAAKSKNAPPSAEATHPPVVPSTVPGDHGPPPRMPGN